MSGAPSYLISIEAPDNELETNDAIDVNSESENKVNNDETQARVDTTVEEGN
jgi:hypothetical protein